MRFQVLLYHGICIDHEEIRGKPLREYISRGEFLSQIQWLKEQGCLFLTLRECRERALANTLTEKGVCLTFDDGKRSDLELVTPLLAEQGIRGTFFIIPGWLGRPNYMMSQELKSLSQAGMEIGSHSLSHPFMTSLSRSEMEHEASGSKKFLEDLLGQEVQTYSYPFGDVDERVRDVVARAGYKVACGARRGSNTLESDWLALNRWGMHDTTGLKGLQRIFERGEPSFLERGADWIKKGIGIRRYVMWRHRILRRAGD